VSQLFYKGTGQGRWEYWFDDDYVNRVKNVAPYSVNYDYNVSLNTDKLKYGLHSVNLRFSPTGGLWSAPISQLFFKASTTNSTGMYEYWFDNDSVTYTRVNVPSTPDYELNVAIDVSKLSLGLHSFTICFRPNGGLRSAPVTHFFFKAGNGTTNVIDNSVQAYKYWFDNDYTTAKQITLSNPSVDYDLQTSLDASRLTKGKHILNYTFLDARGMWSGIETDTFTIACPTLPPVVNIMRLEPDPNPMVYNVKELATIHRYFKVADADGKPVEKLVIEYELEGLAQTFYSLPSDNKGIVEIIFSVWGKDAIDPDDDYIKAFEVKSINFKRIQCGEGVTVKTNYFVPVGIAVYPYDSDEKTYGFVISGNANVDIGVTSNSFAYYGEASLGAGALISLTNQFENSLLTGMKYSFKADAKISMNGFRKTQSIPLIHGDLGVGYNTKYTFKETLPDDWGSYLKVYYDLGSSIWNLSRTDENLHYTLNAIGSFLGIDQGTKSTTGSSSSFILNGQISANPVAEFTNSKVKLELKATGELGFEAGDESSFNGATSEMLNTKIVTTFFNGDFSMEIGFDTKKTAFSGEAEASLSKNIVLRRSNVANTNFLKSANIEISSGGSISLGVFGGKKIEDVTNNVTVKDIRGLSAAVSKDYTYNFEFGENLLLAIKKDVQAGKLNNSLADFLTNQSETSRVLPMGYMFKSPMTDLSNYLFKQSGYLQTKETVNKDLVSTLSKSYNILGAYEHKIGLNFKDKGDVGASYKIGIFLDSSFPVKEQVFHINAGKALTIVEYEDLDQVSYLFSPLSPIKDLWDEITNTVSDYAGQIYEKAKEFMNTVVETVTDKTIVLVNTARDYSKGLTNYFRLKSLQQTDFSTIQFEIAGNGKVFAPNTRVELDYYYPGGEVLGVTELKDTFVIVSDIFFLRAYYGNDTLSVAPNGNFTITAHTGIDDLKFLGLDSLLSATLYYKARNSNSWKSLGSIDNPILTNGLGTYALGVGIKNDKQPPSIEVQETVVNKTFQASITDNIGINWQSVYVLANGIPVPFKRIGITDLIIIDYSSLTQLTGSVYFTIKASDLSNNESNESKIYDIGTGVQTDKSYSQISLYPNPAKSNCYLKINNFDRQNQLTYEILDITGKKHLAGTISSSKTEIKLGNMKAGIYFIVVYKNGALEESKKLMIQ